MKHVMSGRINRVDLLVIKRWEENRQAIIKLGLKMFLKKQNTETPSLAPASAWRIS